MGPVARHGVTDDLERRPVVVDVRNVTKHFSVRKDNSLKERLVNLGRGRRFREDFVALHDIDLELRAGTTIGLIGHNGSGKSTLLKVIGGIIDPSSGEVWRRGRIAALLELGAGFHPDLSGRENVFLNASILGLSNRETAEKFDEIVQFAGIGDFIDTQVKFYSSGMYVRLAFAVAVHTEPDVLLVDEVLSVGDEAFQQRCLERIRRFQSEGRTIILVTHNLGQVQDMCDRAVLLHRGAMVYDGKPREAISLFRDLLEGRRTEVAFAGRVEETGSIRRARAEVIKLGETSDVRVDVEVDFNGRIPDWQLDVQIDTAQGQAVYSTRSPEPGVLGPLEHNRRIAVTITDVRLSPGKYLVSAFILDGVGRHVVDAIHVTELDIPGTPERSLLVARSRFEPLD